MTEQKFRSLGPLKTAMTDEPKALRVILEEFYATVGNKNSEDYEPDSLRVVFFQPQSNGFSGSIWNE